MTNWEEHWKEFPENVEETEFLKQVGKTVQGQPISDMQFRQIVLAIFHCLEVNDHDIVLDLCCGNGLITNEVAKASRSIVGVDYSLPLINVARKYHNSHNAYYIHSSILDLNPEVLEEFVPFTKVYMYEALQHFQEKDLVKIIELILRVSTEDVIILFGSVPDRERLWKFYDSFNRRLTYIKRKLQRRAAIGTWWKKDSIKGVCNSMGLQCEFLQQHERLHTSHYRFDFRVSRRI